MTEWADEFHEMYPNLTMEVIGTSWDDHTTKLSTMAQAGEAPDISEILLRRPGNLRRKRHRPEPERVHGQRSAG